jgi:hypothetical protein
MVPKKELNIYPKSEENLKSLISYYFDKYDVKNDNGEEFLKEKTSLSLNQIEFIVRKLSEAYVPIFQKHLKGQITISNLLTYGIEALTDKEVNRSKSGQLISKEFEDYVQKTEIDFNYLEKNN